ncbi:hypothetical protein AYI70_g5641 [Smittium culicis]|uniref:Integrase zinc-binding domain-containing protein n=1 Tax=Smittium culicis TaxID=133412 RepID=A0A1R1XTH5_9FUNG|nr:hypothetical protein AYI70_g5641 [Smittium culicis]
MYLSGNENSNQGFFNKKDLLNYFIRGSHIFIRAKVDRVPRKMVFEKDEQKMPLENIHNGIGGGRIGRDGTIPKLKDRYFWNKIDKDVNLFMKTCEI